MAKQQPISAFGLIQESLWPNEWLILVACVMLNCTRRSQVEPVMKIFMELYPTPESLAGANVNDVAQLLRPLGFHNRRARTFLKLARSFITWNRKTPLELPGIGEYAARSWDIFVKGEIGNVEPSDGALKTYYLWWKKNSGIEIAP